MKEEKNIREQLMSEVESLRTWELVNANRILLEKIAERTRTEEGLRKSETKFRALAESLASAIFLIQGTKYIYVNPAFESMTGYTVHDLADMNVWDIVHPDFRELVRERNFARHRGENVPSRYEVKIITKNNEGKWIDLAATTFIELEDRLTIMGSAFDITERKQAEEALKRSEKLYRSVIDNIQDTFYRIDTDGNLTMMSPSGATLFGCNSVDELIGLKVETFYVNAEDRKFLLAAIEEQGNIKDYEIKLKRRDGASLEISTSSHQYFDDNGAVLGIEGILRDISRRKRAENDLRLSEERFSKAFHISPAPTIISAISDGRYIDVNDSFLRMLGYTREEMIGRTAAELSVWADYDERKSIVQKLTRQGFLRGDLLHLRAKTGIIHSVLVSAEIIALNGENFILSIFFDITDQKKLESQLRQAQKMEAVGTLAGGIAHDFNNILSAIMGYTDLALADHKENDRLRLYLERVFQAGERARDLVKQILAFSRQSEEKPRPLRASPIIKEVLKLLRASLPSTIQIHQDIKSDPDTVLADPTHIHQILMNLCTNAAYAMCERKGELTVTLIPVEIKPCNALIIHHDLTSGMYLKLTVSDTGSGINPGIMERIFDPFFTTKRPGEGTGMGLSVVYGIVKSYGGAITVQSKVGQGTEFHIYLPLLMETGGVKESKDEAPVPYGKERILFVDDEEILVNLGKEMLTRIGYEVIGRTSSLEALEFFRSRPERFDLVVTDMTMPNMTGVELAQEIMRIRPDMPVILCTGFSEAITPERAVAIGLKDFIMKPVIKNQIAGAIRRAIDQKK